MATTKLFNSFLAYLLVACQLLKFARREKVFRQSRYSQISVFLSQCVCFWLHKSEKSFVEWHRDTNPGDNSAANSPAVSGDNSNTSQNVHGGNNAIRPDVPWPFLCSYCFSFCSKLFWCFFECMIFAVFWYSTISNGWRFVFSIVYWKLKLYKLSCKCFSCRIKIFSKNL